MIKARFIGKTDKFFRHGEVYCIVKSWIADVYTDDCMHFGLWARFNKISPDVICPCCGERITVDDEQISNSYRDVPYSSLGAFLNNWQPLINIKEEQCCSKGRH